MEQKEILLTVAIFAIAISLTVLVVAMYKVNTKK
jgi:hypothetical protein